MTASSRRSVTETDPHSAGHPIDRLIGTTPGIVALRAQIRHLSTFDTLGNPAVPTVLLQGETGSGKGLVARIIHDSGPRAHGPFIEVNCVAIPETMLEAELFGFEAGTFTDAKHAKPGLFEAASGGTLFLDEIDALPLVLQGKLLTAIESKRVRRLGAVVERPVDVKLIAATNAILPEAMATGRFRADLYHRLAVVVLILPPVRARGADVLVLAEAFMQYYTAAHGVPSKRLSATAQAWLREYTWPGNVRELSHVMERVTLLHMGEEVEAETLRQFCPPLQAPAVNAQTTPASQEAAAAQTLPAAAEQIRQALVQTGGNVVRAARLLGLSRDTVRYRMQLHGIVRPRLGVPPPAASPRSPDAGTGGYFLPRDTLPPESPAFLTSPLAGEEAKPPQGLAARQDARQDTAIERSVSALDPAWEQQPVAVLALELTWPGAFDRDSLRYDPWTERARWEQAIVDKVDGFGGALMRRTASRLVWVFGIPQGMEQLPQRAVHSALAIRQLVSEAVLASLVEGLAGASILMLTTCRPGYRAPWLDKSYATQIALQPLEPDDSRQVVRHVMRDTTLTPALEQQLLARAEGNPFFLEELAHTVREHGAGHPALAVPDTIQAVLAARMDRLPISERHLLQAASVIGKDIAVSLLQAIAALPEAALQRGLAHLQAAEFLYETRLVPERVYTFKHAPPTRWPTAASSRSGGAPCMSEQVERLAHHALRGDVWARP